MRRWVIALLVIVVLAVVLAAIFIAIGVMATPHGGSEGLYSPGGHLLPRSGQNGR
jgi:hypothetical protein